MLTLTVCNYGCDFETLYPDFELIASMYTLNPNSSLIDLLSKNLRQVVVKIQGDSGSTPGDCFDEYFWLFGGDWSHVGNTSEGLLHTTTTTMLFTCSLRISEPPMYHYGVDRSMVALAQD